MVDSYKVISAKELTHLDESNRLLDWENPTFNG